MRELLLLIVFFTAGFCQVSWQTEIVDSSNTWFNYTFNALALDGNGTPHIVYYEHQQEEVIHAVRSGNTWLEEVVDSGLDLYFGFSLTYDSADIPHLSYYGRDDTMDRTFLFYCRNESSGWERTKVDSSLGFLGEWYLWLFSSIALDTFVLPGIAYIAWDIADSIHYVKYAHYNGSSWDLTTVEYDSACANTQTMPTDWSPSLAYTGGSDPVIAFYHAYDGYDTIKIGYFDDTLNVWSVEPAINMTYASPFLAMRLNTADHPCIAHGWGADLAYSRYDGLAWHTELTGASMGWVGIQVLLDVNESDDPHIAYLPDPLIAHPCYSYKENGIWHNCGWIEPDPYLITCDMLISFTLDESGNPHVCYPCIKNNVTYLKYAKGTFTGIEEDEKEYENDNVSFEVYPNPFHNRINIRSCSSDGPVEINIYDAKGGLVKSLGIFSGRSAGAILWDGKDVNRVPLPWGIYFLHFKTEHNNEIKKMVLLR